MDARASTSEPQHPFHSSSWSTAATSAVASPASLIASDGTADAVVAPPAAPASFHSHLDFLPFLFPQQSKVYHAQLLHYNKLVSPSRGGGGLQTPPLPPVVSASHVQTGSRSRSSSKVSLKDAQAGEAAAAGGHGSKSQTNQEKSRSVLASRDAPPRMPNKQLAAEPSTGVPQRSAIAATAAAAQGQSHSNSVPSTPHQHARQFSFESRGPSPTVPNSHSPRSAYSETNSTLPSLRPLPPRFGGCKYETAQMNSRRRIPYSVGNERLDKLDLRNVKAKLSDDEERRLATDVGVIFDRLLPTDAVDANRTKLVGKLERIFNAEWPGHDIQVHLFGSSGSLLCSDDSDVTHPLPLLNVHAAHRSRARLTSADSIVDICITTPWRELEGVCMIADLLARRGMEKVVCISAAKVPIVKIWDPELGLACDMNVNNTLALENTRMVRTYVEADPRVRQLAMVIKYWTRRRIVNDAGLGGTLSSYTWTCLIVAFLQLRSPPVLPALHQLPYRLPKSDGTVSDFADNLDKIRGYGSKNKSSVPELLFKFFRFYAHEFDYDKHVLSVRQGRLMTKVDKQWNYQMNNQLCVEEPFNVSRNLGNTADEYAFRGLHLELRRAFDLISAAKLGEACEQYVYPKEEERVWTRPAQQSRPVLLRSSSQTHSTHPGRGGRGAYRGGRHNANFHRGGAGAAGVPAGGGPGRRASASVATYDNAVFMAPMNMQQDMTWYQNPHFQFQYAQQDLMTQMAYHENMRQLQLFAQSPGFLQQPQAMGQRGAPSGSVSGQPPDRSRTNSFDNVPLSAPLRPDLYALYSMGLGHAFYPQVAGAGYGTYPSSPATTGGSGQEFRRSLQRSTVMTDTGAPTSSSSLRSQSQPASRSPSAAFSQTAHHRGSQTPTGATAYAPKSANRVPLPSFMSDDADFDETPRAVSESPGSPEDDGRSTSFFYGREPGFAGHVQPQPQPQQQQATPPPPPPPPALSNGIAFGDLAAASTSPGRRRLSTDQLPQTILDRRMKRASRSPSPLGHARAFSVGTPAAPPLAAASPASHGRNSSRPLVVNGSCLKASAVTSHRQASRRESLQPEDHAAAADVDLAASVNGDSDVVSTATDELTEPSPRSAAEQLNVQTSGGGTPMAVPHTSDDPSFRERVALMAAQHITTMGYQQDTTPNGSPARLSPSARQRWTSRQPQNGVIAPLDLAMGEQGANKQTVMDAAHLSPVYEAGASSPSAVRHNDGFWLPRRPDMRNEERSADADTFEGEPTAKERRMAAYENNASPRPDKASAPASKATSPRVNGHVRGAKSESDGGWQKAGKGKKKAANAGSHHGHGEQLPKHESERKGG